MADDSVSGGLRASSPAGRLWRWIVVDGNRAVLALLTFAASLASGAVGVLPLGAPRATQHILSRFVSSTLPFVTIVAAANQVVLSMDLGPLWELRRQMDEMRDFREAAEDAVDTDVSPTRPADFLEVLAGQLVHCADRLGAA